MSFRAASRAMRRYRRGRAILVCGRSAPVWHIRRASVFIVFYQCLGKRRPAPSNTRFLTPRHKNDGAAGINFPRPAGGVIGNQRGVTASCFRADRGVFDPPISWRRVNPFFERISHCLTKFACLQWLRWIKKPAAKKRELVQGLEYGAVKNIGFGLFESASLFQANPVMMLCLRLSV